MKKIIGVTNKVLDVDLTYSAINEIAISRNDRQQYLGGKGLALKLLHDNIKPGADPLGPDNILVIMTGPTAGTQAPAGGRYAVVGKSPLTGIYASSFVGGKFGLSLKKAGYDGIMVRGKAKAPVAIAINDNCIIANSFGLAFNSSSSFSSIPYAICFPFASADNRANNTSAAPITKNPNDILLVIKPILIANNIFTPKFETVFQ